MEHITRQMRRYELREIEKATKKIWEHSPLVAIMKNKAFNDLSKEDLELLDKGESENKELQTTYNVAKELLTKLRHLEERERYLTEKRDKLEKNEDIPSVDKKELIIAES
jgi:hypothetical protein